MICFVCGNKMDAMTDWFYWTPDIGRNYPDVRWCPHCGSIAELRRRIFRLPFSLNGDWISVEDAMPEEGEGVTVKDEHYPPSRMAEYAGNGRWIDLSGYDIDGDVEAWHPGISLHHPLGDDWSLA